MDLRCPAKKWNQARHLRRVKTHLRGRVHCGAFFSEHARHVLEIHVFEPRLPDTQTGDARDSKTHRPAIWRCLHRARRQSGLAGTEACCW
jgi:hypothetical protein